MSTLIQGDSLRLERATFASFPNGWLGEVNEILKTYQGSGLQRGDPNRNPAVTLLSHRESERMIARSPHLGAIAMHSVVERLKNSMQPTSRKSIRVRVKGVGTFQDNKAVAMLLDGGVLSDERRTIADSLALILGTETYLPADMPHITIARLMEPDSVMAQSIASSVTEAMPDLVSLNEIE